MSLLAKPIQGREASGSEDPGADRSFRQSLRLRLRSFREAVATGTVPEGTIWLVRIIEAGKSLNGPIYTEDALRAAVPVFEGVAVRNYAWSEDPAAKDAGHLPDEVRVAVPSGLTGNLVGSLEGVHYNEDAKSLDAFLKVYDKTFRERLLTAFKLGDIGEGGNRDTFGFSIDALGDQDEAGNVIRINTANELTAVCDPAAGGRVRRLVASASSSLKEAATVRKIADGYGVFVDGKQVGKHATEKGAQDCADARNRMSGSLTAPEADVHAAMKEADKATHSAPGEIAEDVKDDKQQEASMKPQTNLIEKLLKENVGKLAGQLKLWADQLSTASDEDAPKLLEAIRGEIDKALDMLSSPTEEESDAESQEASSVKKDEQQGGAQATADDFARMSAGMGKITEALRTGDPVKLREAAIEAAGEEPTPDPKDREITALKERLKGQAISQAMSKLTEELRLVDPATVLTLIDRSALQFDSDFSEVTGLKEAIKAVLKDRPYFVSEEEAAAAPAAAAAAAGDRQVENVDPAAQPAPVAAAPAPAAQPQAATPQQAAEAVMAGAPVNPLGQNVPLRESIKPGSMKDTPAARQRLQRLQRRMLAGDHKAMKKHRDLRHALGL